MSEQPPEGAERTPRTAGGDPVGPYTPLGRRRRDRIGVVVASTGPEGPVRVRLCRTVSGRDAALAAALVRLATLRSASVAPVLDRLAAGDGRLAVVTTADAATLADRRRGSLPLEAVAALAPALLDGLAAIHDAGLAHGRVRAESVGIAADGAVRWQDAGIAPALGLAPDGAAGRRLDVSACAAMLRDAGPLPEPLRRLADDAAAGSAGATLDAAALAAAWRRAAAGGGVEVPPPGASARIPALLPPPRRPRRRPAPRLPHRTRLGIAGLMAAAGVALLPATLVAPGAGAPLDDLAAYLPAHDGGHLTYRLTGAREQTVVLVAQGPRTVAGVTTVSLTPPSAAPTPGAGTGAPTPAPGVSGPCASDQERQAAEAVLPFGLSGGTVRLEDGAAVRTADGGAVRDLVAPLAPGTTWTDRRTPLCGFLTVETRTLLGPTALDEPVGHLSRCAVVDVRSVTQTPAGPTPGGHATLWYCPGVGLARASLDAQSQHLDIDLVGST